MKKIYLFVLLIFTTFSLFGCFYKPDIPTKTGDKFQTLDGFKKYYYGGHMYMGASSNTDTFDINQVELNLYYGLYDEAEGFMEPREAMQNDYKLHFVLYVYDPSKYDTNIWTYDYTDIENYYFIKALNEEEALKDDKYSYKINESNGVEYNHKEKIVIPSEVFTKNKGDFYISIVCYYYNHNDYKYYFSSQSMVLFSYEKTEDSKIILNFNEKI